MKLEKVAEYDKQKKRESAVVEGQVLSARLPHIFKLAPQEKGFPIPFWCY